MKKVIFITAAFCLTIGGIVEAKPDFGISCGSCHAPTTGRIAVTGADSVTDLGQGSLKTFIVSPGSTTALSVNLLNGSGKNSLQIKGLESGGKNSSANKLIYTGDSSWVKYGTNPAHYTKDVVGSGVYSFNLLVNASTPADFYEVTYAVGTKDGGLLYQEERFYVQVQAAAPTTSIAVVSPNGGESLAGGQTHTIQWDSSADITTVTLAYSTDNGSSWTQIAGNIANSGSYNWAIPQINSSQTLIRATGGGISDVSNAVFSIVWTPASQTVSGYIKTSAAAAIAGVTITSTNGGTSATTDAAGFYSIAVPYNWSGTVTPTKADYTFEPATASYNSVATDVTAEDYTGSTAGYNLADHVFSAEIEQVWDHGFNDNAGDLRYIFYVTIETDATVNLIDILTPAGNTIQIPADAHTQTADTQTWHSQDAATGNYVWEYEGSFVDAAELDNFGDGVYVVTLNNDSGTAAQTNIRFGIPNSTDPVPQPIQEPVLTYPANNSAVASPATLTWPPCTDTAATTVGLGLDNTVTNEMKEYELPVDAVNSSAIALSAGTWNTELSFENSYKFQNPDGIDVTIWKYSTSISNFEITPPEIGESIAAAFDIDTDGFVYNDDAFGTSLPAYADGTYESSGGYSGGAIKVYLGPGSTGGATSGGWTRSFALDNPSTVSVDLRYRMVFADGYESHEYCEGILAIDGVKYGSSTNKSLVHLTGDGDGGLDDDTGWLSSEFEISLTAGEHTITVGAYNNGATSSKEWVEVFFDDISLSAAGTIPDPDPDPDPTPTPEAFIQDAGSNGIVSIEAENFDDNIAQGLHTWNQITSPAGFSGGAAMQAGPDTGSNTDTGYVNNSPRLDFNVDFVKTGTHYIWIRGYKTDGTDDSCHIGLDGQAVSSADRIARWADINQWLWSSTTRDGDSRATFNAGSKGVHTVNVWMREDGFRIDKIVLTTNPNYVPTSVGPVESQRPDIDNQPPIPIPDPIDTISITKAQYHLVNQELIVEATSTDQPQAELDLDGYGQMTWNAANNKYEYRVEGSGDPQDWVTVNSSLGGSTTVSVNYVDEVIADTVTVTKAEYNFVNQELTVEATSTDQPQAELDLDGYGQMTWNAANNKYEYRVEGSADPQDWITVNSSLGGFATVSVNYIDEVIVDTVTVTKAEYNFVNQELRVEATSTDQPDAVLDLDGYGQMTWNAGNNKYEYRVEGSSDPKDWVTVNSSLGGSTTVSVTYKDVVAAADVVTITKAEYKETEQELRVEATSSEQGEAELYLEGYGQMTWNPEKGKYEYRVKGRADPDGWVTVTSSLGGAATSSVYYRDAVDGIVIKKAEYKPGGGELIVQAYAVGQPDTELTVEGYGQMVWKADKSRYEYKNKPVSNPGDTITVAASNGNEVIVSVEYKY